MPKLMFIITGLVHGGAEIQVTQLAIELHRRGWKVQLISMVKPEVLEEQLRQAGVETRTLNMRKGVPDPRAIWKLRQYIRAFRPDVVHSHMVHANLLARVTRMFTRVPLLISTAHNMDEGGRVRMLMYRMTDRLSELTTNVSREAVEAFVRKKASPRHKMMMMPNGVDLAKFTNERKTDRALRSELGIGQDEFVWLAIGRLVDAKDYPTMLKAWAIVRKASAASALIIVGEGPDRLSLENLSRDLGLTDSVRFLGIRSDISSLMSVSDAYVMSSLWEGLPMVLLEASACELPIVATNVGGNREIIRDGISGYLTDSACPEQLADKMISLMKLPIEQREDMGRESRRFVMQHYEIGKIISQWESLYTDYVKSGLHRVGGLA